MLELAAPEAPAASKRRPMRLALVLDRSGSMRGEKLAVAKRCAAWLAERLQAADEMALVAYDDRVRVLAPLGSAGGEALGHAIAGIAPGGSTNLSGGWLKALEQLRGAPADGPRKILLLTDGIANVGVTEPAALVAMAASARDVGVGTSTIGFGDDFREELLQAMADAGGGNYHYAPSPDAAPGIFAEELDGLARVVAQNISVLIRPREHVRFVGVLNDFPSAAGPGGVQVELPDAYGGERRRVVFRLHVPRLGELGAVPVADLVVRYVAVGADIAAHEVTIPVVVNAVSAAEAAAAAPDAEVRDEVLVLKAARAREEAIRLADAGDHHGAQLTLRSVADDLRVIGLTAEAAELEEAGPLLAPASYSPALRKQLHFQAGARKRRRRPRTPSPGPDEAA
jgi:Ca-activated chloride channel family protein